MSLSELPIASTTANTDPLALGPTLGVGVLYNSALPEFVRSHMASFDFLEIIPDMFWTDRGTGRVPRFVELEASVEFLDWVADQRPLVAHNISLSIGSADLFDYGYVEHIANWHHRYRFPWHSDHLSLVEVSDANGHVRNAGLAVPVPYDREVLDMIADRITHVLRVVPTTFLIENNVYYVDIPEQEMTEPEFLNRLTARTGCGLLLDVHNLYANARNHRFDPLDFLQQLDLSRVVEVHIAGGNELAGVYTDSHAGPCPEPVWRLLEHVVPNAPNLRGVTFEFHDSYYPLLKTEGYPALNSSAPGTSGPATIEPMTLRAFQQAFCDLIASPSLCLVLRDTPDQVLDRYDLSLRERRRLVSIVWQRGMSTNCSLYRVNRITPIYTLLPHTCFVLGDTLVQEVEQFWDSSKCSDLQFKHEVDRFGSFLMRRIWVGAINNPLLEEVLEFELSENALRFMSRRSLIQEVNDAATLTHDAPIRLHPLVKVVCFRHEPARLLQLLAASNSPPYALAEGKFFVLLSAVSEELECKRIDAGLGHLLLAIRSGTGHWAEPSDVAMLLEAGLAIRR